MATLEPNSRIPIERYLKRREDRLRREQLEHQSIYALYVRTERGVLEAARFAATVELANKIGSEDIELTLLDEDLKPKVELAGEMKDGLWHSIGKKALHVVYYGQSMRAQESYLLDYDDGLGMPTIEQLEGIRSPEELVSTGYNYSS